MEKLYYIGLLFLNFITLNLFLSLVFFVFSAAGKRISGSPYFRSRLFFLSLIIPPIVSTFTIATSFIPPVFVKLHDAKMPCLNEPYCYIFSFIPEFPMFNVIMTASVILVLMSAIFAIASLASYFSMLLKIYRLSDLDNFWVPAPDGIKNPKVKVIDTPLMLCFVWGYLRNIIVISTGTLKTLSADELKCLIEHEASHCRRRDNILKGVLLLSKNILFIFPHVSYLFQWWKDEIELISDDSAVMNTGKPMDVASAILKMQKGPACDAGMAVTKFATGFISSHQADGLTRRIERLVAINDSKMLPVKSSTSFFASEIGIFAGISITFTLLFGMIYETDPLLFHCYLEKLTSVL